MKRYHPMPFGAEFQDDGQVHFRIWAPGTQDLALEVENAGEFQAVPLTAQPDGWFSCRTDLAGADSRYRYVLNDGTRIPDPASRFQPDDVHGASEVIDPAAFDWSDSDWRGRPWEEAVIYELHVGTYTPEGTLSAVRDKLTHLAQLGVTAVELMPVSDFPGNRNWGYDGVLPFAPDSCYGRPEDLKALVNDAHALGMMVFLDVVYNHFGPEGNYLHLYASDFFTDRHQTPWGAGLNFDGPGNRVVRDFFIHNALYWLEEYNIDGLRLDAIHAIQDDSRPDIIEELATAVRAGLGRDRQIHLVLENDDNAAHYLARDDQGEPQWYVAQWNDDIHHACHVLFTGETQGYYRDYADDPVRHLARCLCEGFAFQGEPSAYRNGERRGEPSADLPVTAFVAFVQNHDQVGNRAFGERLAALTSPAAFRAATALLLLAPPPPLLFMGQEWNARQPFPFFCDFGADLAEAVTEGRRQEFARFPEFQDPESLARVPDPMAEETFRLAVLDWADAESAEGIEWLSLHRELLGLRRDHLVPLLAQPARTDWERLGADSLSVRWEWQDGATLTLLANFSDMETTGPVRPPGDCLYATHTVLQDDCARLPGWGLAWYLEAERIPDLAA